LPDGLQVVGSGHRAASLIAASLLRQIEESPDPKAQAGTNVASFCESARMCDCLIRFSSEANERQ
jgi:hypothetical protein